VLILKFLLNFLNMLNQKVSSRQIAAGLALGVVPGLTPTGSLHNLLVLLVFFYFPVNKSAALITWALFSPVAYALDPVFHRLGEFLLTQPGFLPLWETLYNTPVVPWTRFNNTLVLGSLTAALILVIPAYYLFLWAVNRWRDTVVARASKWKIVQILKATKLGALVVERL
jgi:uncharacterized protein (TIGR03546 family)